MDLVVDIFKYGVIGFFSFVGLLFAVAIVFGKRIEKKWEYEAKFRDERRRELGEFDIELSRVEKEEQDYRLQAKFVLRHPALTRGSKVEVVLDDVLVMEAIVQEEGRIRMREESLVADIKSPAAGQVCVVQCSGVELFAEALYAD